MSNELKSYIGADPTNHTLTEYYLKSEADKVIAEKDKEIAELKARIQLDDDEIAGFLQLEEECGGGDLRNYIAELKRKLEDVQASMYADVVDANMENRRLRRALWIARAERNKALAAIVHCQGAWYDILDTKQSGKFWNKGGKLLNASKKCRAKAEEYK